MFFPIWTCKTSSWISNLFVLQKIIENKACTIKLKCKTAPFLLPNSTFPDELSIFQMYSILLLLERYWLLKLCLFLYIYYTLSLNLEEIKKQGSRRVVSGFGNDHFRSTTTKFKKANKIHLLKSLLRYFNLEKNEEKKD